MTRACIEGKIAAGKIEAQRGADALSMLDELEASYRDKLSPDQATIKASHELADRMKVEAIRKKRLTYMKIIATDRIHRQVNAHPGGIVAGALSMLGMDLSRKAPWQNVDKLREGIRGQVHAMWHQGLNELKVTGLGWKRQRAKEEEILRGLFGDQNISQSAKDIASSWTDVSEFLRARFNKAGGDIGKLDSWLLPQSHDMRKIGEVSVDEWKTHIHPLLDRSKMLDQATGKPISDEKLELVLHDIYETLKTDGINKLKPGAAMGKGMLANRRADPRVLHFKDADSWLAYQKRFGTDDIFSTLTGHMDRMANDIAWMEIMGPNPAHMKQYIVDLAKKEAVDLPAGKELWNKMQSRFGGIKHFENTWDEVSGLTSTPVNARMAERFSEARALQTSAKLGSAFISGFSDLGTMAITAKMNSMKITKVMANHLKLLLNEGARDEAVQLGLVADGMAQVMGSAQRYAGEMMGTGMMSRVADSVMRASLLKPWTDAAQWAFGKEFLGMLSRKSSLKFDELDDTLKATFKTYGIGQEQWNIMRKADQFDGKGAKFMNPMAIARLDMPRASEVAEQVQRMVLSERDYAVITSHARVKAHMHQGLQRGTLGGEALRSVFQFKNFPATFMALHYTRMAQQGTWQGKASYAAAIVGATTAFGMVSLQGKQIKDGKDFRDITDWKTWKAAMLQGGGAGILADFLFSDQNRFGGSPYGTALGPLAGTAEEVLKLTIGNMQQAFKGEDTNFGSEAIKLVKGNTPFLSLWYLKLGIERKLLDQLTLMADPKAHQRWNRMIKKSRKEYGQDYFWRPGASAPRRAPEMNERR